MFCHVLFQLLILPNVTSFVYCQIHFGKFFFPFFYTIAIILVKEVKIIVVVDDLNFRIRDVAFEAKVFNKYGTFDQIANRSMEI